MSNVWPSRAAYSADSYLEHFLGASLPAIVTRVTSGTGSGSVTDSYSELSAPVNSASFQYLTGQLDKTRSGIYVICQSMERLSGTGSLDYSIALLNGASAPTADTAANISAKALVTIGFGGGAIPTPYHPWYFNGAGTQFFFDRTNNVWTSVYPGNANLAIPYAVYDDYQQVGIELDGVNARWRLLFWHQAASVAGTYEFDQGWRNFTVTPWVNWSDTRSNANVWLVMGQPTNDSSGSWRTRIEWIRYCASISNAVRNGLTAAKTDFVSHTFRNIYTYDGTVWLPVDASTDALTIGGAPPDDVFINDPRLLNDGAGTDWCFYKAISNTPAAGTFSICLASRVHDGSGAPATGALTRFAGNPILTPGVAGAFDDKNLGFPFALQDMPEADANKRIKLLYGAQRASDGVRSIGLATAPDPDGPWTKQGALISFPGYYTAESAVWGFCLVNVNGGWELFCEVHDAVTGVASIVRATGTLTVGGMTLDGNTYYAGSGSTGHALTANLGTAYPGRTVTIADTTDYQVDDDIIVCQSAGAADWGATKVRKKVSGTVLETYHGLQGFTTAYPARIRRIESAPNCTPRDLERVGVEWWLDMTVWEPFFHTAVSASYGSLFEENYLYRHSAALPSGATFVVDPIGPITSRTQYAGARSVENMTLIYDPFTGVTVEGGGGGGSLHLGDQDGALLGTTGGIVSPAQLGGG